MTCNSTAVYKSFVNENAFFQATIDNFSLSDVFQALQRYFKRFDTTNIRREIIFWSFCFGAVYMQMHLRRSASMRLDCINTHKF